ncbi:MAG: tRNA uridine-5-carboxymethylaminomethyl(34) synthesis GTPase MnmE [Clostridia bacterium]|nr:tRNA uridine-5-carboxymethylaminomethyl(34) synthesis GTPase MnmE [Clostridia bacterium]
MIDDVIVAIATPLGKNGVGVIRMSGQNSFDIARKMFVPFNKNVSFLPNKMILGKIILGEIFDTGYFVYFKNPKSFTGEDVVEFQAHGGVVVTQKIVEQAIHCGARLAEPGEFSKRAFLNGKLSLDQAEGIIDTINAESELELKASGELSKGELTKKVKEMQDNLTDILSEIEVNLDYPEHDIEYITKEKIRENLQTIKNEIESLLETSKQGKFIKNGINIAIVGKTNVGKSSLLNSLLGEEFAIVTDVEGTTRDVVIGSLEYKGMKFNFLDTAGLRKTDDKVEKIGIEKTKQAIEKSDIVLLVIDSSRDIDEQDKDNLKLTKNKKRIVLLNKCDLKSVAKFEGEFIKISAKQKTNTEEIKEKIYQLALDGKILNNSLILTNIRHINVLLEAKEMLCKILADKSSVFLDCTAMDVKEVWEKLGEITGESVNENVINKIFSKFCLGK